MAETKRSGRGPRDFKGPRLVAKRQRGNEEERGLREARRPRPPASKRLRSK